MHVADNRECYRSGTKYDGLNYLDTDDPVKSADDHVETRNAEDQERTRRRREWKEYRAELAHPDRAISEQGRDR